MKLQTLYETSKGEAIIAFTEWVDDTFDEDYAWLGYKEEDYTAFLDMIKKVGANLLRLGFNNQKTGSSVMFRDPVSTVVIGMSTPITASTSSAARVWAALAKLHSTDVEDTWPLKDFVNFEYCKTKIEQYIKAMR
jgi:hypothetical protein